MAVPALPFPANPATAAWWESIWSSPMAPEWDASDVHGLYMLAFLVHGFWSTPEDGPVSVDDRKALLAEIRLQCQRFGLSPLDRRRLQWEIDRGEEAMAKTVARKAASAPVVPKRRTDPRLKAV